MPQIHYRASVIVWMLACLLVAAEAPAGGSDSASTVAARSKKHERNVPVAEWFRKYDQVRRDAEMTMGDKFQSLLLAATKPEKKNAALASRMIAKYSTALSKMKELQSIPETKELQDGYIKYFGTAHQLFADYLAEQKKVPFTNQSLVPTKKKLEELDKTNKRLDDELRKKYGIFKHKHS